MIELNDFSVLTWNIRGVSNASAKRHIQELVRVHHPTVVFLFENKVQFCAVENFWKSHGYVPVAVEEARGRAGGIWCLKQDGAPFSITVVETMLHAITIRIDSPSSSWCCTRIYVSPSATERVHGWEYLKVHRRRIMHPWMIVGDFNETLYPSDQNQGAFIASRAEKLASLVEDCNLLDIMPKSYRFTWARKREGEPLLLKKLDWCFVDVHLHTMFQKGGATAVFPHHYSDHHPLLVRCAVLLRGWGPRLFRFEAAWVSHPSYKVVVSSAWDQSQPIHHNLGSVRDNSLLFNK